MPNLRHPDCATNVAASKIPGEVGSSGHNDFMFFTVSLDHQRNSTSVGFGMTANQPRNLRCYCANIGFVKGTSVMRSGVWVTKPHSPVSGESCNAVHAILLNSCLPLSLSPPLAVPPSRQFNNSRASASNSAALASASTKGSPAAMPGRLWPVAVSHASLRTRCFSRTSFRISSA